PPPPPARHAPSVPSPPSARPAPSVPPPPPPPIVAEAPATPDKPAVPPRRSGSYQAVRITPPSVNDRDVLVHMRDLLVHRAPVLSARMRIAAVDGRMDELGALARELRDEASQLALVRLGDLCARLERQARAGTPEAALAAVQAIEEELLRSRKSIGA
ncbi:MAG TPA: Hpt domain-containing protein, partial [Candidatus Nanopelagicales bacterium]|nr:Hpt domain-containing protein [Candidatus Nanopelagicales bacterium]